MEEIIAGLEGFTFAFEQDVELQKGTGLLPFQGMDKSSSAVCNFFAKGLCEKGMLCPLRHEKGKKMVVCKHWLRGLCRKADSCKFLHQYDVTRMPVCYFHSKFGNCSNKDCFFLHVQPTPKPQDCPWYNQGFCKDGPLCKYRHVHQVMCLNYFTGFCPKGPKCQLGHPKMSPVLYPSNMKVTNASDEGCTSQSHQDPACSTGTGNPPSKGAPMASPREFCTQWSSEPHHPSEIQDAETAYSIWPISNYPACEQAAKKNTTGPEIADYGREELSVNQ